MGSKFILLVFLAKLLTPGEVGTLNLMTVTIANGVMLAGMQFFLYANRELAAAPLEKKGYVVRNQMAFYGALYCVVFPLALLVFVFGLLPWALAGWFFAILVSDHASYELQRVLASTHRAVKSNVIHTVRTGLWVYPMVVVMFIKPAARHLTVVWAFWLSFSLFSVMLALWYNRRLGAKSAFKMPTDWEWIRRGMRTTLNFLPVTISLLAITLVDRYSIERWWGRDLVGVYALYSTIANLVVAFPEAGLTTVMQPQIIAAYAEGRMDDHRRLLRQLGLRLVVIVLLCSAFAAFGLLAALKYYVRKPIYTEHLAAFWVILLAAAVNAMGMWPHNELYSRHVDKMISRSSIVSAVVLVVLIMTLVPRWGLMGAGISLLICWTVMFALKYGASVRSRSAVAETGA
ncbi:Membrane protein involved in the export of O-antigen and teichoic acid [Fimbriimonas ginsengisoli Gsoil 348]|uniref:Membrane protein involved in the export of O-antigen and teichoic acid n=2 Tax=Fimbriimonas ginsengisoli TaxID=1005039 RepID=A0A068NV58_FIMGI|nr:Membrane protein involved in the export of O-antigen and teichoic acid [Fimbriimonas ginsengisoli Gsoil 348]